MNKNMLKFAPFWSKCMTELPPERTGTWSRKMLWTKQPPQAAAFLETL